MGRGRKGKYSRELADKLIELYSTGKQSIKDICIHCGICQDTFFDWLNAKPYFADGIANVKKQRLHAIGEMALSGLAKLVDVYEYDEIKDEYAITEGPNGEKMKGKVKSRTVTKKIIMPNAAMVQYALNNLDKENFKTASSIDHKNDGGAFSFANFLMEVSEDEAE